jgi:hypothetical protein
MRNADFAHVSDESISVIVSKWNTNRASDAHLFLLFLFLFLRFVDLRTLEGAPSTLTHRLALLQSLVTVVSCIHTAALPQASDLLMAADCTLERDVLKGVTNALDVCVVQNEKEQTFTCLLAIRQVGSRLFTRHCLAL